MNSNFSKFKLSKILDNNLILSKILGGAGKRSEYTNSSGNCDVDFVDECDMTTYADGTQEHCGEPDGCPKNEPSKPVV